MIWIFILVALSVLSCEDAKKVCDREEHRQNLKETYYRCEKCGDIHKYRK